MEPTDTEIARVRQSLSNGECLRCGHLFEKRKLFCPKCGSPNFLARPKASATVTVAPFVVIVGFFLLFYRVWQESGSLAGFADKGLVIAAVFLVAGCAFALWTLRSAATVRRVRQDFLAQAATRENQTK
jgi:predicted  nucleic acid-binding Zn-ribbon protein